MIGILMVGGSGTRFYPSTIPISKHLFPIYDKPMFFYPLSVLMLLKIKKIIIIVSSDQKNNFEKIIGDGSHIGINIIYIIQDKPRGIADCFILSEKYIKNQKVCLILGDNFYYGQDFVPTINKAKKFKSGCVLFGYRVSNPSQFAIASLDDKSNIKKIVEKPKKSNSNICITGLYFYDTKVLNIVKKIKSSKRGELEITSINQIYLKNKDLSLTMLGRGMTWIDAGTPDDCLSISNFVQTVQKRQNSLIGCIEEIALNNKWVNKKEMLEIVYKYKNINYFNYVSKLISIYK